MGKIILYTGGARSGKSLQAQHRTSRYDDVAYIATAVNTDEEMNTRIDRHKESRPNEWKTYECPWGVGDVLRSTAHEVYLIDCVTVLITNLILEKKAEWNEYEVLDFAEQEALERFVDAHIAEMLEIAMNKDATLIVVSNEVGMGVVPPNSLGRLFRDVAGRANQRIAAAAQEVYLTVSGIPLKIKG